MQMKKIKNRIENSKAKGRLLTKMKIKLNKQPRNKIINSNNKKVNFI